METLSRCTERRTGTLYGALARPENAAVVADTNSRLPGCTKSRAATMRRQFWLGLSGEPSSLVWRTELRDGDGNRLPVGYPGIVTKGMAGAKNVSLSISSPT